MGYHGDGSPASEAAFHNPEHLAFDSKGDFYICDNVNHRKRKIDMNTGVITTVLGKPGDQNTEMHSILVEYDLPYEFPKEVEEEASHLPIEITKEEISKRKITEEDIIQFKEKKIIQFNELIKKNKKMNIFVWHEKYNALMAIVKENCEIYGQDSDQAEEAMQNVRQFRANNPCESGADYIDQWKKKNQPK